MKRVRMVKYKFSSRTMPVSIGQILEARDSVIGDRHAKRKCNSGELLRQLHGQISSGDQEAVCAAAALFGSLVLECSSAYLNADEQLVFELLIECVMNSSSATVACACLRAMANCFVARKQPYPLTQQFCSRMISFILDPRKCFNSLSQPGVVVDSLDERVCQDLQVCSCRLLSASGTFLQFCSEYNAKVPLLKPSFKAALSSGPSFDARIYSDNCLTVALLAFAPGTSVRLTAAILDALASSPRPLFIFSLLQLKHQPCMDLLHAGHPSVRAALSRLLIVTLSSPAAPFIVLNGLGPSDASRALCRLLAMSETAKQAVQVIASLLRGHPSRPLLDFFLCQRIIHAMCALMVTPNLNSSLLELLFDCMAKLTSSFEEARRVVVDFCEEQELHPPGCLLTKAFGHMSSSASSLRLASAKFVVSMSRSPLAIRTVFVDAAAASMLLSLLSCPYFDEATQPDMLGEVCVQKSTSRHDDDDDLSYSAAIMAVLSNCLLPFSLFRDVLVFSGYLVPLVCRCSMDSNDPHLKTNSLCAISSALSSQTSQQLKIDILNMLDVTRFLNTLETGSALDQELCVLVLRNCADGPAEDVGALLLALKLYDCPAAQFTSHFSEFCLGAGNAIACVQAGSARMSAPVPESPSAPNKSETYLTCLFHDCPVQELDRGTPSHSISDLENCARIRQTLAFIVRSCSTSSPASIEQLLLLLSNIASASSGRKALILDALQPPFMAEALTSNEDVVRRVCFCCPFDLIFASHVFACGTLASTSFELEGWAI
jgi:hypothetical protein